VVVEEVVDVVVEVVEVVLVVDVVVVVRNFSWSRSITVLSILS
jgi:hypothetical protein